MDAGPQVLVIDDATREAHTLARVLRAAGYTVAVTTDCVAGLIAAEDTPPALILLAWDLPFISAATILQALHTPPLPTSWPTGVPPAIALVGAAREREEARAAGARDCLVRPIARAALLATVRRLLPIDRAVAHPCAR